MDAPAPIRIGTSGWNYPSGRGAWTGVFYPSPRARARSAARGSRSGGGAKLDELAFYADHFDTVEVNSSFYRVPSPETTRSWARRTPPGFEFSVKLFQRFTHPAMATASGTAAAKESGGSWIAARAAADVGQSDVDEFRRALDPLASSGKLGALLAQFPPSFKCEPESLGYLDWLLTAFRGCQVAVELRHRSWSDQLAATLDLLNERGAAWVQIDEPKFRYSIRQNFLPNVTTFYYLRLHGRNAAAWWNHEETEDRYNYLYSRRELEPFAETATAARRLVRKLYLYMNNHFEAKAVANAVMLKQRLNEPITGEYPESFLERFPELRDVVPAARAVDTLF